MIIWKNFCKYKWSGLTGFVSDVDNFSKLLFSHNKKRLYIAESRILLLHFFRLECLACIRQKLTAKCRGYCVRYGSVWKPIAKMRVILYG